MQEVYNQIANDGIQALDGAFPYDNFYPIPQPSQKEISGDSPALGVPGVNVRVVVNDNGGTSWNRATGYDQFTTWLMYQPPSKNNFSRVWVPLQNYSWSWSGEENLVGGSWIKTEGTPGVPSVPTATETNDPPQWMVVQPGALFLPPPP